MCLGGLGQGARPTGVVRFDTHVVPLGLMHQSSRHGIHRRGEVSSPDGLGNPTPTGSTFRFLPSLIFALNFPYLSRPAFHVILYPTNQHLVHPIANLLNPFRRPFVEPLSRLDAEFVVFNHFAEERVNL